MKLSVLMPTYNEERTIVPVLKRLHDLPLDHEVIVIDDGSTDRSAALAEALGYAGVKVVRHEVNRGKGVAIRTGLRYVTGQVVVVQDADLEYNPQDFIPMVDALCANGSDVVYGSRVLKKDNPRGGVFFYLGGRFLSLLTWFLYGQRITDEPTCYKMFRAQLIRSLPLQCKRFEFCPEVTARVLRLGKKIAEVPIHYSPRSIAEGKKIRFRDAIVAALTLLRYRILPDGRRLLRQKQEGAPGPQQGPLHVQENLRNLT